MDKIGCTTPFGKIKDNICLNQTLGLKALEMLDDQTQKYKKICQMPCNYVTVKQFKVMEYGDGKSGNVRLILNFSPNIKSTEEYYLYTPLSLIAEVGGYVGLFLGVSFHQIKDLFNFFISKY